MNCSDFRLIVGYGFLDTDFSVFIRIGRVEILHQIAYLAGSRAVAGADFLGQAGQLIPLSFQHYQRHPEVTFRLAEFLPEGACLPSRPGAFY